MRNYNNGLITKNNILNASKELFYEKGYYETTYDDICRLSGANPSSISHHFGGKNEIGVTIYTELSRQSHRVITELFPSITDELLMNVLPLSIHHYLLYYDGKYRRFSIQISSEKNVKLYSAEDYTKTYPSMNAFSEQSYESNELGFYFAALSGIDYCVEAYIDRHIDELTFEEIVRYYNRLYFAYFAERKKLNDTIEEALALISALSITNKGLDFSVGFK